MALSQDTSIVAALAALQDYAGVNQTAELITLINGAIATNNDAVKTNVVSAINSKLGTSIAAGSSWPSIIAAISGGVQVKKFATGTTTGYALLSSQYFTLYDGTSNTMRALEVTNINFKPRFVFIICQSQGVSPTIYMEGFKYTSSNYDAPIICESSFYKLDGKAYANATGFKLPVSNSYYIGDRMITWYAYE